MWIVRGLGSYAPDAPPSVLALGAFDGIHLGHRAILGTAVARARARGLQAVACTFDPHPMEVLQPGRAPLPITTLDERLALIGPTGIDGSVVLGFDRAMAAVEPEAFVRTTLLGLLRAQEIVVGFNHTFGRGAGGNAKLLRTLGDTLGFQAHVVPPLTLDGVPVSSTEIRGALQQGDVERAARFLGRAYDVAGDVVQGAGRGRTLGFPTANVAPERPLLVKTGVYACRVERDGASLEAVANVGVRPTFGDLGLALEVHLLDFTGDLYGERLRVAFTRRLRDERKFPSVEALREQIAADVEAARAAGG
jgi:riboflavin kinase/FMN adenylyltransferase